jgi:hypothetical protein
MDDMTLVKCKCCNKTYPKAAMENEDYCSDFCIKKVKEFTDFFKGD